MPLWFLRVRLVPLAPWLFTTVCAIANPVYDPFNLPRGAASAPLGFDMYILAQSWQPTFCFAKAAHYPGCRAPQRYWRSHLTLHGLWPERQGGGAPPSFCSDEAFDVATIERELGMATLHEFWPDVKFQEASPLYADFWKHEWMRHGTCSGLAQVDYFTDAIDLERNATRAPTPDLVQDHIGGHVNAHELRAAFGGDAALKCQRVHGRKDGLMFAQVFTCWQKDEHQVPTRRRSCPPHVLLEDTCGQGSVAIPAFPPLDGIYY